MSMIWVSKSATTNRKYCYIGLSILFLDQSDARWAGGPAILKEGFAQGGGRGLVIGDKGCTHFALKSGLTPSINNINTAPHEYTSPTPPSDNSAVIHSAGQAPYKYKDKYFLVW